MALGCGTLITEDTVLGADIGPCGDPTPGDESHTPGGHGIVIGASGITLDLNGHTIFGKGGSVVAHQAAGNKIDQQSHVTVRGGTVRDFSHGVWVLNGSNNRIHHMVSVDNTASNGIVLQNVRKSSVIENIVSGSGRFGGISIFDDRITPLRYQTRSGDNTIAGNVVHESANGPSTAGISVESGSGHRVINNQVTKSAGDGISLRAGVTSSVVRDNDVWDNRGNGISLQLSRTTGAGADDNRVVGNRVHNNARHGIFVAAHDNRIQKNRALGNGLDDLHDSNFSPPCDNNTWRKNAFSDFNQPCVTG